jgi:Domain of unknown function (DUF4276)
MLREIRIYYEGSPLLKEGFDAFFAYLKDRARAQRCSIRPIAGGGSAVSDFAKAIRIHREAWNILLIDSEKPYSEALSLSICRENQWADEHAGSIFWMVQMMESWFHADKDALERFYGSKFRRSALARNPRVEEIPKVDLLKGLRAATTETSTGEYHKTRDGSQLLARIDPELVRKAAPNCAKLFDVILAKLT